jgi:DNA-binding SARP family transcriptional activator
MPRCRPRSPPWFFTNRYDELRDGFTTPHRLLAKRERQFNSEGVSSTMLSASHPARSDGGDVARAGSPREYAAASRFRILGPVEAWAADHQLELGGPRQRALLAFLLLHANRAVTSDALIDGVWPRRQARSGNRLAMAIGRLRRALGPLNHAGSSRLRTVSCGYLLSVEPGELDADVFRTGVQAGRRALDRDDPAGAVELLDSALALWHTAPLADVYYENFAQAQIRYLEELHLVALETRADAELQLGHHLQLIADLEQLSVEHPSRERVASQLMLALYRAGRQADALEVYQRVRVHLAAALGLQPGLGLRTLHIQILRQSTELEPRGTWAHRPLKRIRSTDEKASREGRRTSFTATWAGLRQTSSSSQTGSARLARRSSG